MGQAAGGTGLGGYRFGLTPRGARRRPAQTLRHVDHASREMTALARAHPDASGPQRRALEQAARELLLLEASDCDAGWFRAHLSRFRRLAEMVRAEAVDEAWLSDLGRQEGLFPELDYRLYA